MNLFALFAAAAAPENPVKAIADQFGWTPQLFISQVVLFLIVAFTLRKFAFGPIQKTLEERREKIAQGLANAEKSRAELANAQNKSQEILSQAGAQATKMIEEARQAASRVGEQERQKAIADAQQILAKAREAGDAEIARLKSELRKEFGRLVVQAASRSTGGILTGDQQNQLSDTAVRQMAA